MNYKIGDVIEADYGTNKHMYFIINVLEDEYVLRTMPGDLERDLYCCLKNTPSVTYRKLNMSLTKEMIIVVDREIESYNNSELITYNKSYTELNSKYPNSFFQYRANKSYEEIINRGLEPLDALQDRSLG